MISPGDKLYMQRQMVPIGDLATAAPVPGQSVDAVLQNPATPPADVPAGKAA